MHGAEPVRRFQFGRVHSVGVHSEEVALLDGPVVGVVVPRCAAPVAVMQTHHSKLQQAVGRSE